MGGESSLSTAEVTNCRVSRTDWWPLRVTCIAAFGRGIPAGCVAPPSDTPGILGRRALLSGAALRNPLHNRRGQDTRITLYRWRAPIVVASPRYPTLPHSRPLVCRHSSRALVQGQGQLAQTIADCGWGLRPWIGPSAIATESEGWVEGANCRRPCQRRIPAWAPPHRTTREVDLYGRIDKGWPARHFQRRCRSGTPVAPLDDRGNLLPHSQDPALELGGACPADEQRRPVAQLYAVAPALRDAHLLNVGAVNDS